MTADIITLAAQGRLRGAADDRALRVLGVPYADARGYRGTFQGRLRRRATQIGSGTRCYGATSAQPDRGITMIPEPIIAGDNELNLKCLTPISASSGLAGAGVDSRRRLLRRVLTPPLVTGRGRRAGRRGAGEDQLPARRRGFLEVPDAPANRAVRDWVRALEWVAEKHRRLRR